MIEAGVNVSFPDICGNPVVLRVISVDNGVAQLQSQDVRISMPAEALTAVSVCGVGSHLSTVFVIPEESPQMRALILKAQKILAAYRPHVGESERTVKQLLDIFDVSRDAKK